MINSLSKLDFSKVQTFDEHHQFSTYRGELQIDSQKKIIVDKSQMDLKPTKTFNELPRGLHRRLFKRPIHLAGVDSAVETLNV